MHSHDFSPLLYLLFAGWLSCCFDRRGLLKFAMVISLYEPRQHGIMVVVFIKTNIQLKMMSTARYHDPLQGHLIEGIGDWHVMRRVNST